MKTNVFGKLSRGLVYLVLVTGAAVFSFPFLWMASTSAKVEREIQREGFHLLPNAPQVSSHGPFIDRQYFQDVDGPELGPIVAGLREQIRQSGFVFPDTVNSEIASQEVAMGLYDLLNKRMPREIWQGRRQDPNGTWGEPGDVVEVVLEIAKERIGLGEIEETFSKVYRQLLLGEIRLRSYSGDGFVANAVDAEGNAVPVSQRLVNRTPDVASLSGVERGGRAYAWVQYDYGDRDEIVLANTIRVPDGFDPRDLHRVEMPIVADDTWFELTARMQVGRTTYHSARAFTLENITPQTAMWQPEGGPDDTSTKIKTWIDLVPDDEPAVEPLADNEVYLELTIKRVGLAGAWLNKVQNNYIKVNDQIPFWRYLRVSVFLVIANIVLTLLFSSLTAYAFARLNWPGRNVCFILMLGTMMIPPQVMMIPQFLIWKTVGAYNTLTPLWLGAVFGNAFFIFLLRQFMKGIPRDLEDAARIDGCGFLRVYWHIILPLIKPSLAAIAIFTFIGTWNNFMGPLIYLADQRLYPLAFGLYAFSVQVGSQPTLTMAASLLMTVPIVVIFFFAQKYFIQGITLTGMKQ